MRGARRNGWRPDLIIDTGDWWSFEAPGLGEDGGHQSRFVQAPDAIDLYIANFPDAYGPMH